MQPPTPAQVVTVLEICQLVYSTILGAGPKGLPSGHLYASMMSTLSLESYEQCIAMLERMKLVQRSGHVLIATPPK